MKVSDYEIDWSSGAFTCCMDHVENCEDNAYPGMEIECDHCGIQLKLEKCGDGKLRWRAKK